METYYYVNIFETKGLEYLLLVAFLVLFIFLVKYLQGPKEERRKTPATSLAAESSPDQIRGSGSLENTATTRTPPIAGGSTTRPG